jgi:hypothetical protein
VLLWINGPMGGGKTATAFELHRRIEGSVVCDPERLGKGLHRMLPPELRTDFQHFAAWRQGVHEVLSLVADRCTGPIIVPMLLAEPDCFAQTVGRLREDGHDVRHFTLLAERATLVRRRHLRGQDFGIGRDPRALAKIDDCLARLQGEMFAEHIRTDGLAVGRVADIIARAAGLEIEPSTDGVVRNRIRLYQTTLKHVNRA